MRLFFDIFSVVMMLSIVKYCLVSATPERKVSSDADEMTCDARINCTTRGTNVIRISDMLGTGVMVEKKEDRGTEEEKERGEACSRAYFQKNKSTMTHDHDSNNK